MKQFLLLLLLFAGNFLWGTVPVPILYKNGTTTMTLTSFPGAGVQAKAYDRATGTFYVGLGSNEGALALSSAQRPLYGNNSIFVGLAHNQPSDVLSQNDGIEFLTLATSTGNLSPNLALVVQLPASKGGPLSSRVVVATNANATIVTNSAELYDASGATNNNGQRTQGIVGLAASQYFIFPAVRPCGGNFGSDCNGGIASVAINQLDLGLTQVPADPGDIGIKATLFDPTIAQVNISPLANSPIIVPNTVELFWDDQLQRLYIGIQLTTATNNTGVTCSAPTGVCYTGPLFTCPTGFLPDPVNQGCLTCPSGGFYNGFTCQLCPPGQLFNPSIYQCQTATCPTGSFFNPSPAVLACVTCPPGWFFNASSLTCVTCAHGYIYDYTLGCIPCGSGLIFSPTSGICVPGPISCPPGTIENSNGQCVTLIDCPSGLVFNPDTETCGTGPFPPDPDIPPIEPIIPLGGTFDRNAMINSCAGPQGFNEPQRANDLASTLTRAINSGGKSVVVASVDSAGIITLEDIAPDSAFALGNTQTMVGVVDTVPHSLAINKIRTMHASTGASYLIINGGNGTIAQIGGDIYALPLVDLQDPTNANQGTIADGVTQSPDHRFIAPATVPAQMPQSTQPAVMVGTGPLTLPAGALISDIDVVGDTVYVSINANPSANSEGGIVYSQALFDQNGRIIDWTPWTKKAFPPFSTSGGPLSSAVTFFAVDAVTSKVWAIDSLTTSVVQTAWNATKSTSFFPDISLIGQLNAQFTMTPNQPGPATAVLDLDQSTRGFQSNLSRYALFAGDVKGTTNIFFARVSQALGGTLNSPQTVITNYSLATNFMASTLPSNANCAVQVLEYARQLTGTPTNYFFAGNQNGLLVFSDSGNGFDVSAMGNLNAPPFSNGSWSLAPNITGAVVDIKTTGNSLYVLTQTPATSATSLMQSTLYSIPFAPTVTSMFAAPTIIAQTGVAPFINILTFNAIGIISTNANGSTEQIVLATNNGLYQSTRAGGVQQPGTNVTNAGWMLLANTAFFYNDIASVDNAPIPVPTPTILWPFHLADPSGLGIFNGTVLQQLAGTTDAGPYQFVPTLFNSITAGIAGSNFATLPFISYFWSDGARRISVVDNIASSCAPEDLLSLPFNTIEWALTYPLQALIDDPVLNVARDFYWVKQIGVTGILMVGTDNGVIGLE